MGIVSLLKLRRDQVLHYIRMAGLFQIFFSFIYQMLDVRTAMCYLYSFTVALVLLIRHLCLLILLPFLHAPS